MSESESTRVFFAIRPDEESVQQLLRRIDRLRSSGWENRARFATEPNLHLTLRFVGEVGSELLGQILQGAKRIAAEHSSFDYEIGSTSLFPRVSRARIIAARIENPPAELKKLARDLDRMVVSAGAKAEKFPYRPHITLARIRAGQSRPQLSQQGAFPIPQHANDFGIYRSTLKPEGAEYELMETFQFG